VTANHGFYCFLDYTPNTDNIKVETQNITEHLPLTQCKLNNTYYSHQNSSSIFKPGKPQDLPSITYTICKVRKKKQAEGAEKKEDASRNA
jgi:hypothetical protein